MCSPALVNFAKFKVKSVDADQRTVSGMASVFGNKDLDGDIIDPQAFTKQFSGAGGTMQNVKMLWQHAWSDVIGKGTATLTNEGIEFTAKLSEGIQKADEALILAKDGIIDSFSIGFRMLKGSFNKAADAFIIEEAKLMEVSLVTFPANPLATISEVKSKQEAIEAHRSMVGVLREAGYSKQLIERFSTDSLLNLQEADALDDQEITETLKQLNTAFNIS